MAIGTHLLKGAIIQFSAPMLIPIPNVIVFQYNPETMTRTLTPWAPAERTYDEHGVMQELTWQQRNALAQPYDPQETFSLTLFIDAADGLEHPDDAPGIRDTGIADRLSALEMLLYPPDETSLGRTLGAALDSTLLKTFLDAQQIEAAITQRFSVPVVLFVWGPGRIVPVRITTFSVEEMLYNTRLYPIRAKVTIGMRVLDETDMVNIAGVLGPETASVKIAKACYTWTRTQKKILAAAAIAKRPTSIINMLPS